MTEEKTSQEELEVTEPTEDAEAETAEASQDTEEQQPVSEREQVMERIAAQNAERRETQEEPAEEEEIPVDEDEAEEAEEVEEESGQPEFVTVRINGQDKEVDRAKVEAAGGTEAYAKNVAADARLRQAAEREREIARREQAINQRLAQLQAQPPETKAEIEDAEKFVDLLVEDEDEARKIFASVINQQKELQKMASSNAQQLAAFQEERQASLQRELSAAQTSFREKNEEILNTPARVRMAGAISQMILEESPHLTTAEHFEKLQDRVRDEFGPKEPANPGNEAKKRMPKPLKKAGGRVPPKAPPKPMTATDVIAQMREQRGQRLG